MMNTILKTNSLQEQYNEKGVCLQILMSVPFMKGGQSI